MASVRVSQPEPELHKILLCPALGPQLLQYLRWADIQRLSVCCRAWKNLAIENSSTFRWLQELEILKCLDCPEPYFVKILDSIRYHPDRSRVLGVECSSAQSEPDSYPSLEVAFQRVMLQRLFEDGNPIPFASATDAELQSMLSGYDCDDDEVQVEGAYVSISKQKKKRKFNCRSEFCKQSDPSRYFFVRGKTYCGQCVDNFFLLKLRFCWEHVARMGGSGPRDFSIGIEFPAARAATISQKQLDVKDDGFWVRLFYESNRSDQGEICFVGVDVSKVQQD